MSVMILTEHHFEFPSLKGGPAGAAFAGPTFLAEYAFHRVPLSRFVFFFFELNSDFIAFQQQRQRPACADAQSGQRLCCSISGKYD